MDSSRARDGEKFVASSFFAGHHSTDPDEAFADFPPDFADLPTSAPPPSPVVNPILRRRRTAPSVVTAIASRRFLPPDSPKEWTSLSPTCGKSVFPPTPGDQWSEESSSVLTSNGTCGGSFINRPEASSESSSEDAPAVTDYDVRSRPPETGVVDLIIYLSMRVVFFHLNLMGSFFKLPFWFMRYGFLLVTDPFGTIRRAIGGSKSRLLCSCTLLFDKVSPLASERSSAWQWQGLIRSLSKWCFWFLYACVVLSGLAAIAFLCGSLLLAWIVEAPVQVTQELSFDYTKGSPEALVALAPCCRGGADVGGEFKTAAAWRPMPPNHKVHLTVLLSLPESDYNRKLGVFQVKVEFLSADGTFMSSLSQPCMLPFKSYHIRFAETFLKSIFLLAGYSLESQDIRIKMTGFTEGTEPTACLRVKLEQRAEHGPGCGIPEIYAANLKLEEELPLLKRIMWNTRWMLFAWITMVFFIFELLFVLLCCRPVLSLRQSQYVSSSI